MNLNIKGLVICLALIAITACASPNDRIYREAMARYYQTINTGGPLVPAYKVTGERPYQNTKPKTFAIYDRYGSFQGTIKERVY